MGKLIIVKLAMIIMAAISLLGLFLIIGNLFYIFGVPFWNYLVETYDSVNYMETEILTSFLRILVVLVSPLVFYITWEFTSKLEMAREFKIPRSFWGAFKTIILFVSIPYLLSLIFFTVKISKMLIKEIVLVNSNLPFNKII